MDTSAHAHEYASYQVQIHVSLKKKTSYIINTWHYKKTFGFLLKQSFKSASCSKNRFLCAVVHKKIPRFLRLWPQKSVNEDPIIIFKYNVRLAKSRRILSEMIPVFGNTLIGGTKLHKHNLYWQQSFKHWTVEYDFTLWDFSEAQKS